MGCCVGNPSKEKYGTDSTKPWDRSSVKGGKIEINCPICQETYDIDDRKPYIVCANKHKLCLACLSSMKNHASLKRNTLLCPFCKGPVEEDMISTDAGIYGFLEAELDTLKRLPADRQKLFAFSSIYLPQLHKFMKEEVKNGMMEKKSGKREKGSVESIEVLRIKGRMLEEYQVFEMEMLQCMPNLRKVYLNNNHIKAIDTNAFIHNKITLLDLSNNKIASIKNILSDASLFAALKVLNACNNLIEELPNVKNLQTLQVIGLKHNNLKTLGWFVGCTALRHLDLEFNQISGRVEFPACFSQLYSLLLFGNPISLASWEDFPKLTWKSLRLLTASVGDTTPQNKRNIKSRIAGLPAPALKLIINQVGPEEPQSDVEHVLSKEDGGNCPNRLELKAQTYLFYIQNESYLKKFIDNTLRTHSLGINFNFKASQFNHKIYEEDERTNTYKKIGNSQDPADYLVSSVVGATLKGKVYVSFTAKTTKILVGVRDKLPSSNQIQLNLNQEKVSIGQERHDCKLFKSEVKAGEEFTVSVGIHVEQGFVCFAVGGITLDNYYFTERWSEWRFYIHLEETGSSVAIIREEIDSTL